MNKKITIHPRRISSWKHKGVSNEYDCDWCNRRVVATWKNRMISIPMGMYGSGMMFCSEDCYGEDW